MLRSILVVLDGSPWCEPVITLAFDWATRFRAALLGLGVVDAPSIEHGEPVPMGAYVYKSGRLLSLVLIALIRPIMRPAGPPTTS